MRRYLGEFFERFQYVQEDASFLLAAYDRIAASEEMHKRWQEALRLYDEDILCDYSQVISIADVVAENLSLNEYTLELLVFICLTKRAEEVYRERGLAPEIFYNTMLDLRYKLEECKAVYGVVGTFVASWFAGFFRLTRFALGRLQFEIIDFGDTYEKNGRCLPPDSKVINIHIPRTGTPMDPNSCDEAFAMAKEFFKREVGDPTPFVCSSWLLYPENKDILPETSNTYKFLMRFDVYNHRITKDGSNLWRLFDTKETNPDRLPTDTSFRRRYVEHLKKGGKLGSGKGVFFL